MIGQSMINVTAGGAGSRLAASIAAVFTLVILLAAYPLIGEIPVASLVGVMWVVSYKTFDWGSLKLILAGCLSLVGKRPPLSWGEDCAKFRFPDAFVILAVTIVTLFYDLAVAVFVGIVISSLDFSWNAGNRLNIITEDSCSLDEGAGDGKGKK